MIFKNPFCLITAIIFSGSLIHAQADEGKDPHTFSVIEENDMFNVPWKEHQDRHYTQGLKFIYLSGAEAPWWAKGFGLTKLNEALPSLWMDRTTSNYGLLFGQNIYTPENHQATNLIVGDRPYAGWMYVGIALQRQGMVAGKIPVMESFELNLGVVGPEAQGGRSQNEVHQIQKLPTFGGWGNQIKTEPAIVFKYGRAWKLAFSEESGRYFDVIPNVGANIGTIMLSGNMGVATRLGFNLPEDFGVQTIDSPLLLSNGKNRGPVGFYIFGQLEGRAVGRNVFLDGNTFKDSWRVEKKPLVGDIMYGAVGTLGSHFEISWTFVTRTLEFDGQRGNDKFGSLAAKIKWGF